MSEDAAEAVDDIQAEAEAAAAAQTADALECLIEAGTLDETLDLLQSVAHEAILRLGRDGLEVRVVDPANVIMIDLSLSPDAFADVGSGSFPVGVNLGQLQDYLSKADAGTLVSLSYDAETRRLNVSYGSVNVDMATIDPDAIRDEPDISELDLPNTATVDYQTFRDGVDVAEFVGDHLTLVGDPDAAEIQILAEGDTDDVAYTFDREDVLDASIAEETETILSIDYLLGTNPPGLLKQMPKAEIDLTFGDEFPVFYEFDIADGNGEVLALQAPRIAT